MEVVEESEVEEEDVNNDDDDEEEEEEEVCNCSWDEEEDRFVLWDDIIKIIYILNY